MVGKGRFEERFFSSVAKRCFLAKSIRQEQFILSLSKDCPAFDVQSLLHLKIGPWFDKLTMNKFRLCSGWIVISFPVRKFGVPLQYPQASFLVLWDFSKYMPGDRWA
jgi:hypothetical protein